jgi:transposase-like protein
MTELPSDKPELFKGRHFNHLLIIQAVRWYVTVRRLTRHLIPIKDGRGCKE